MNKVVYLIWTSLTTAITGLTAFCLFQPYWYIHDNHIHSFGLTAYCEGIPGQYDGYRETLSQCKPYGGYFSLTNIPSAAWQASFLLYFTGGLFFGVAVVAGVFILCVRQHYVYNVNLLITYLQTSGVLLMIAALVTFPIGLRSHYFRYFCGESATVFYAGECSMGWNYMLSIMSVALSIFCPILWYFRDMKWNEFQFKEYV